VSKGDHITQMNSSFYTLAITRDWNNCYTNRTETTRLLGQFTLDTESYPVATLRMSSVPSRSTTTSRKIAGMH